MNAIKSLLFIFLSLSVFDTQAMAISSLMLTNPDGQAGVFTLDNTDKITYFLKTSVSKVEIIDNKIIKTPYTRENLDSWEIATKPSKLVIEPNMVKEIQVESICGAKCGTDRDRVYQINIQPVSYSTDGKEQSKIDMLFGFSPYYIVPAKESKIKYHLDYKGEIITAKNSGNTLINIVIDQCEKDAAKKSAKALCKANFTILAGRTRDVHVPKELQRGELNLMVLNHDETFREEITLPRGE
ncbi:fimbrial biogenesis chaperone [Shewanella violacea]|uniref:Pili assembly chaperone N-terminal domain-containing protein n=1 Tax=Shewanella violacea (strain JCM 10179 / CIP 106290 / LMG 19151 / DSS12) TaxID=637905 RepID=D4ZAD8_SHEVD|nr:hypothetical protein [Shewanella violacea]BAJ02983.1 hypothetical protein SVI_3012 [Shewanella violacea DSS12]